MRGAAGGPGIGLMVLTGSLTRSRRAHGSHKGPSWPGPVHHPYNISFPHITHTDESVRTHIFNILLQNKGNVPLNGRLSIISHHHSFMCSMKRAQAPKPV